MNRAMSSAQMAAQWLVRLELILLSIIYLYFVMTDQVPLPAFGLIALIWLARWITTKRLTRTTPLDMPILILLAWLPISSLVSIYAWQSLPKVYGVILGAAFFYAIVNAIQTKRDLAWGTFWLVVVCAGMAFAGLIGTDWAQGKIISASFIYDHLPRVVQGIPRSIAGGFARNGVGGTLTFVVPLLAALLINQYSVFKSQYPAANGPFSIKSVNKPNTGFWLLDSEYWLLNTPLLLFALILALVTLALTQSRGGLLGVGVGLLAIAIWRERRLAWLIGVGILVLIGIFALGYGNALVEFMIRMDAQNGTLASRVEVWRRGVMMVQDFPFTGIGIGTYNSIAHLLYPFFIASPDEIVAHAHNQFLEVAVDLGIPGLIAYTALLTSFMLCAIRAYHAASDSSTRALIAGTSFGMLAHQTFGLTDAFILGTKPGVLMWIFFAFVATTCLRRTEWQNAN